MDQAPGDEFVDADGRGRRLDVQGPGDLAEGHRPFGEAARDG
jgi:hypothetical protein